MLPLPGVVKAGHRCVQCAWQAFSSSGMGEVITTQPHSAQTQEAGPQRLPAAPDCSAVVAEASTSATTAEGTVFERWA
jgi:hypothetical protein